MKLHDVSKLRNHPHLRLERLEPFGLRIVAREPRAPSLVAPECLKSLLRTEKLLCLRGFESPSREGLLAFARSYPHAELLHWESGPVMEMKVSASPQNYLFSTEKVPFHWDGAFHKVPSLLVFHCLEAPPPEAGGETLFTDTEGIWKKASDDEKNRWLGVRLTYETAKIAHYGGSATVPMVQRHPRTRRIILRFAEAVETELNPVSLQVEGVDDEEKDAFLETLRSRIYSPEHCYQHRWEPGDLLIADNHALIHGRNAFRRDCPRHLRRIQIL